MINRIIKNFERPSKESVERFLTLAVANIDDCMERVGALDSAIKPIGYREPIVGTAFTVKVAPGDNLFLHAAMDLAIPGDIIVIDAGGYRERAIFGELMANYMKIRGVRGIICDGAVRDAEALKNMENFQVYAKAITPNGPYKNGPGAVNIPVVCGGKLIYPGDIVVADGDGVVVIRPDEADNIYRRTKEVEKKEREIMNRIEQEHTYVRPWVQEILERLDTKIDERSE